MARAAIRIGIDLGGTKIAGVALDREDRTVAELRVTAPRHSYAATIEAVAAAVTEIERRAKASGSVGIGMPGSLSPRTGTVQNANSTWLNGRPFAEDLALALGRPVRVSNDANCFALSEARDGAAAGMHSVFGVILGTGCGGGVVVGGRLVEGPNRCGGEWGHTPLPWPDPGEAPGPDCWCGRRGCLETWLSGPGLAADHARATGVDMGAGAVAARAAAGDAAAEDTLRRHVSRLARGLAVVVDVLDPDAIVLGGGLSRMPHLYEVLPEAIARHVFADHPSVSILPPRFGDASGVRGAARLWDAEDVA